MSAVLRLVPDAGAGAFLRSSFPGEAVFGDIVAGFDELPRCEIQTSPGTRCNRAAEYFGICHECGRGLMCLRCVREFVSQLHVGKAARCNRCGRVFSSIADALTVVEL